MESGTVSAQVPKDARYKARLAVLPLSEIVTLRASTETAVQFPAEDDFFSTVSNTLADFA